MCVHEKLYCINSYTYETRASFQVGSPNCRQCEPNAPHLMNIESHCHIVAGCSAYEDLKEKSPNSNGLHGPSLTL